MFLESVQFFYSMAHPIRSWHTTTSIDVSDQSPENNTLYIQYLCHSLSRLITVSNERIYTKKEKGKGMTEPKTQLLCLFSFIIYIVLFLY